MADEEIPIVNEIAQVGTWQPYNFLKFVEEEMQLRGREYQILDLQADLGAIKISVGYATKCGKSKYEVVKFLLWALDGITDERITSLQFLPRVLHGFFGNAPEGAPAKARERREIELSPSLRRWLDELKAEN